MGLWSHDCVLGGRTCRTPRTNWTASSAEKTLNKPSQARRMNLPKRAPDKHRGKGGAWGRRSLGGRGASPVAGRQPTPPQVRRADHAAALVLAVTDGPGHLQNPQNPAVPERVSRASGEGRTGGGGQEDGGGCT